MPSESALDRVARVLDLIPYLHQRDVRLADLALDLGQSVSDLERDLEIAFLCGLPGYTPDLLIDLTMEDGHVAVTNPQSLDIPRRLSLEEITSLRLGLELIQLQYPGASRLKGVFESLRNKLVIADESAKDPVYESRENRDIEAIESAIVGGSRISFSYLDSLGRLSTNRRLSPFRFLWRGGRLLVHGFDHDRDEVREFFTSQMTETELVPGEVKREDEITRSETPPKRDTATIRLTTLPMWWKRRNSAFIGEVQSTEASTHVQLHFWSEEWLVRALIPVLDLITSFESRSISKERLRTLFLSHFSASDAHL